MKSKQYRQMIYFAHATIHMYSANIKISEKMSVEDFYELNKAVMDRVFQEGINIMEYELSHGQIMTACKSYLVSDFNPQDVAKVAPFELALTD